MDDPSFTLVFVCTGNTCRSPLAEALARREAERRGIGERLRVRSAGIAAYPGMAASEGSRSVAISHGLDLTAHRSSNLTPELARQADLVLGMSPAHVTRTRELAPDARVALLGSHALGLEELAGPSVPDPVGAPLEVYEQTYAALEELVGKVMDRLEEALAPE
ncbi:MAG: hypothetical protein JSU98_04550 [Gemmatimonadales bacterium]|nr:MAG: hypothetical protein JSU98_04550 [Gemmatimonadales bacterium]